MAVIRDMIPAFELFQPTSVDDALSLLAQHGDDTWVLAGGLDSFDWFKDRIKRPKVVVELSGVEELKGIRSTEDGVEIGAMTTLTEVATNSEILASYGLLATAASQVATPQIRNQGTLGGNVSQDTRCWYYRGGWPCYRAGGNICYASAPQAMNREHCIFGADRCVAVNPSDTAPALIALDAKMIVKRANRERVIDAEDFFIGPGTDITRMTVLRPGDLLTSIRIPATWAGASFYWEKVEDRKSWDFALVSVARAMRVSNGSITEARVAVNGVAPYPMRLDAVEAAVRGRPLSEETAQMGGEVAVRRAKALRHNDYKLPLLRNLVRRALRGRPA
ncbi:MAG: xanthine dehydrogenase family protein subunit M [Gemmatimonadetes bacterium]|nr:xanthine dehydrogenase family protein subunit M [Gemmatimonadota bacterium]